MERFGLFICALMNVVRRLTGRIACQLLCGTIALAKSILLAGEDPAQPDKTAPQLETLTGAWSARARLEAAGVQPFALLTAEGWGNVAGGLRTGAWYNHHLDFGVELDTTKLGLWPGGSMLVQLHWNQNSRDDASFAGYTGAFHPVSSILAENHFRVYNLWYRQAWREETFVFKAGQLAADDDFMGSDYAGLFINSAFGAMPSQVDTPLALGNSPAFPIYPVAAPGVFFSVAPAESWYAQAGVYYGRPGPDTGDNYGFDWAGESPFEVAMFFEGGYRYQLANRPATLRLGSAYHTGRWEDFSSQAANGTVAAQPAAPSFYAIHDWALLASPEGKPVLGLFWRGGMTPEPEMSIVSVYTDAGLNWFGPLPGRPDDVAGAAVSYTRFGDDFRRSTSPGSMAADETTLELTYRAQLTRWLSIQADTQLLFNPAVSPKSGSRETAVVLGLGAQIAF